MGPVLVLVGYYDHRLVALSAFISILAAYTAFELAERIPAARGGSRAIWLYGGATAMGIGIWAMHYVGIVAFHLPIPVMYDWPTVLLSLFTASFASGVAFFIMSRPTVGWVHTVCGSLVLGCGIAATHHFGLQAMRLHAHFLYSRGLMSLSVVLAMVISFVALHLALAGRQNPGQWNQRKLWSGLIMGLGIPIAHYADMEAVRLVPDAAFNGALTHAVPIAPFGLSVTIAATIVILGHVYLVSIVNRRFSQQAQQLTDNGIQLKTIFDNLMEGIIVLDKRSNLVQINPAATRILGLPGGLLPHASLWEMLKISTLEGVLVPADDWPGARALRGEYVQNVEVEIQTGHGGKRAIVEISTAPIANTKGEPVQAIIAYRDVTERKRTEEARARLAAIVESSDDAILGEDLDGIVTSWNKGAEKNFGYQSKEMIGQPIQCLMPPGREYEEDDILRRIRQGETVHHLETARLRKDGQIIQVSLTISPILDSNQKIIGASKIARDITERKLLERQWRQSQKMEAIGQLTGGIAHDFNNLLAIVIGNLGLMERMITGNEDAMKRLKPAQKAAARGADLVRRLLALASKEDLNPANIRVEDAIQETIELAGRALGPEIKILCNIDNSVPTIYVDAAGLESALLNLAVNARDAMPKGGTLTFNAHSTNLDGSFPAVQTGEVKPGAYARISVSDTGEGMSKETLERALEPFFTTKPRNKGTGLGLAMVYGFARQSGGTVRIYSEEGYGTTVSLYLPLGGESAPASCDILPAYFTVHAHSTVLVVDDEAELLDIAHAYLEEMGYSTLRADNAASALKTVAQYRDIDLMITDIIMPGGMNGVELAEQARRLSPKLKVVYSSGFPADALVERSGTMIDGPLLRKPYQRAEFAAIIQHTLEGPAL